MVGVNVDKVVFLLLQIACLISVGFIRFILC